jgi:hypothetical protein
VTLESSKLRKNEAGPVITATYHNVCTHLQVVPVLRQHIHRGIHDTSVVEEDVEIRLRIDELGGGTTDARQVGQVDLQEDSLPAGSLTQLRDSCLNLRSRARGDVHFCTLLQQNLDTKTLVSDKP